MLELDRAIISLDAVTTLALAGALAVLGAAIRRRSVWLERYCIPGPVIGGLLFSVVAAAAHGLGGWRIDLDTVTQTPLMVAFFATVGWGASARLLRGGGSTLPIYLGLCWLMALLQSGLGVWLARAVGVHPVLGLMAGPVALEGGHGNAAAFGATAQQLGVADATLVGIAAATYGLVAGGLLGGPLGRWFATRFAHEREAAPVRSVAAPACSVAAPAAPQADRHARRVAAGSGARQARWRPSRASVRQGGVVLVVLGLVLLAMGLGDAVAAWWRGAVGVVLPAYVGAMFVAIVLRNIADQLPAVPPLSDRALTRIGSLVLALFLTMAMMSLRLWELAALATPLLVMLSVQTIALLLFACGVYWVIGRDYDAAVICAGLVGHGLGATPTALANMDAVCSHFGRPSPKAFLVVPLCGAVLIDIVGIPMLTWFIGAYGAG